MDGGSGVWVAVVRFKSNHVRYTRFRHGTVLSLRGDSNVTISSHGIMTVYCGRDSSGSGGHTRMFFHGDLDVLAVVVDVVVVVVAGSRGGRGVTGEGIIVILVVVVEVVTTTGCSVACTATVAVAAVWVL